MCRVVLKGKESYTKIVEFRVFFPILKKGSDMECFSANVDEKQKKLISKESNPLQNNQTSYLS